MTSSGGSKNPKNEFFGLNSAIFQPISMKLGKPIENDKTQILVYFGQIWIPLWRHNRGSKCPKINFFDQNRSFFNQSQWNLAKMLRMEKHKFWSILVEIEPSMTSSGGQKPPKMSFLDLIRTFFNQSLLNMAKLLEWKNANFGVFWPKFTPSVTSSGAQNV